MHIQQIMLNPQHTRGRTEREGNVVCLKDRLLAMRTLLLRLEVSVLQGGEAAEFVFTEEEEEGLGEG